MARVRKSFVIPAALVALMAIGGAVAINSLSNSNRHFVSYVHAYATNWRSSTLPGRPQRDRAWIDGHEAAVVAAGTRSCAWLAKQPNAPRVDPSGRHDVSRLAMHYVTRVEGRDIPLARMTKWSIVGGAWNYLCPDEMRVKTAPRSTQDE
jgi:hypothetical protein